MKSIIVSGVLALTLVSVTAFALNIGSTRLTPAGSRLSFTAEVLGDVSAHPRGEARFGVIPGQGGGANGFTISLGAGSELGSILFTRQSGAALTPGRYWISDRAFEANEVRALIMTGSAAHPTGVFQGIVGTLLISTVTDSTISGSFQIEAAGFLASSPDIEGRRVHTSGMFIATRS
jgi:hypothetical protein